MDHVVVYFPWHLLHFGTTVSVFVNGIVYFFSVMFSFVCFLSYLPAFYTFLHFYYVRMFSFETSPHARAHTKTFLEDFVDCFTVGAPAFSFVDDLQNKLTKNEHFVLVHRLVSIVNVAQTIISHAKTKTTRKTFILWSLIDEAKNVGFLYCFWKIIIIRSCFPENINIYWCHWEIVEIGSNIVQYFAVLERSHWWILIDCLWGPVDNNRRLIWIVFLNESH